MKICAAFAAFLILSGCRPSRADQTNIDPEGANVSLDLQIITLPHGIALPLIRDLMDRKKAQEACSRLPALLDRGTAKLVGWQVLTTHAGVLAVAEAEDRVEGGTAFDAAQVALPVTVREAPDKAGALVVGSGAAGVGVESNPPAHSFEFHRQGVILDAEANVSLDGTFVALNLQVSHLWMQGMLKSVVENEKTHDKVTIEQPKIDHAAVTTTLIVKSGERILLGVFPVPEQPDTLELFLLEADVRKTP